MQEHAIDYAIGKRTRFSENLRSQGVLGHLETLGSQTLRAADVAKHLGLARTAPLLRVQLVGKAENRPISASEHYFDEKRFPDFADRLTALKSVSKVYAHYGIGDYTRKWSRITAALPSPEVARLLGQPKTRPILQVEALNIDQAGAPLQYSITRFVGDLVQLMVTDET